MVNYWYLSSLSVFRQLYHEYYTYLESILRTYRWNHWLLVGVWKRLWWMLGIGSLSVILHLEPKVGNLIHHAPCISEFWVLDLFCCGSHKKNTVTPVKTVVLIIDRCSVYTG